MARHRVGKNALAHLLDAAPTPIYLLDERRRIVFANQALLQWLQAPADQVLGARCDYHSAIDDASPESRVAGLCPPPTAWQSGSCQTEVAWRSGEQWHRRRARCVSLSSAQAASGGVLVLVEPEGANADPATARCSYGAGPAASADAWDPAELHRQLVQLRAEVQDRYALERFWGSSPAIRQTRLRVDLAIQSGVNVLISGPPGSGREHVARMIHTASDASDNLPVVTLACPLLDDELLDTTVKALLQRSNELQLPHAPCLLLLDVDQLPEVAQHSLLAMLQHEDLELRALATSSVPRVTLLARNDFRPELVMWLSTVEVELPALRDRREDVPLLVQGELERLNRFGGRQVQGIAPDAMDAWVAYDWPGNIDELFQLVRQAHQGADGPWITAEGTPARLRHASQAIRYAAPEKETIELDTFLAEMEREVIRRALARAKGNKSEAARLLGIARSRLLRRMVQLGLDT